MLFRVALASYPKNAAMAMSNGSIPTFKSDEIGLISRKIEPSKRRT